MKKWHKAALFAAAVGGAFASWYEYKSYHRDYAPNNVANQSKIEDIIQVTPSAQRIPLTNQNEKPTSVLAKPEETNSPEPPIQPIYTGSLLDFLGIDQEVFLQMKPPHLFSKLGRYIFESNCSIGLRKLYDLAGKEGMKVEEYGKSFGYCREKFRFSASDERLMVDYFNAHRSSAMENLSVVTGEVSADFTRPPLVNVAHTLRYTGSAKDYIHQLGLEMLDVATDKLTKSGSDCIIRNLEDVIFFYGGFLKMIDFDGLEKKSKEEQEKTWAIVDNFRRQMCYLVDNSSTDFAVWSHLSYLIKTKTPQQSCMGVDYRSLIIPK